jgi:hypothetical protein
MKRVFVFLSILCINVFIWAQPDILIERDDVPLVIGQWANYEQNSDVFQWDPFDSLRLWWDLTSYPGGQTARVHLLDPSQGWSPAPESFPNAEILELDTLGPGDVVWTYISDTTYYFYVQGIDYETGGFRFLGNYMPDYQCYVYPIYDGAGWNTAWTWSYEVYPTIVYTANESHQKRIVAKGKVKVPFSGEHFWPCLVIRDYMEYSDNFYTWDTRWIYEWIVPGRFGGGNGVAAAQSTNGGSQNFMLVDNFFKMSDLYVPGWDLRCPDFANTTIWSDTSYTGPFVVSSTITDSTGIGADTLYYNINNGSFSGVGHDSANGDIFYFTIPAVAQPCTLGYFLWAEDSFSVLNSVDIWNTDPICAPESTYYVFNITTGIEELVQEPTLSDRLMCYPNPFHENLNINLWVLAGQAIKIKIFDNTGRCVKTLSEKRCLRSEVKHLVWNGTDQQGRELASGIYFIEHSTEKERTINPVLFIK